MKDLLKRGYRFESKYENRLYWVRLSKGSKTIGWWIDKSLEVAMDDAIKDISGTLHEIVSRLESAGYVLVLNTVDDDFVAIIQGSSASSSGRGKTIDEAIRKAAARYHEP